MAQMVLVTGGAGFIGSHLVEELVRQGYLVRVIDNLSRGKIESIESLFENGKVDYVDGDIRYKDAVDNAMKGVDFVFHEAATNINRSQKYPEESFDVNFRGSQVVFKSALDHGIKKVIFASSASVYGQPKILPMSEEMELEPITPYCVSKLASEYLLKFYHRSGLKFVVFRYFNVYGTRQHTDAYYTSVILKFVENILNDAPPIIIGDGRQSMDFIHVSDIVRANILAMESNLDCEVINLGSGESISVAELANIIIRICERKIEPIFKSREVLVTERRADTSKANNLLKFTTEKDFVEGIREIVDEIRNEIGKPE